MSAETERRERRERIATSALTAILTTSFQFVREDGSKAPLFVAYASEPERAAQVAVKCADALIAELDKPEAAQ